MKTNTTKHTGPIIASRGEMESLIGDIAAIKNRQRLLAVAMDEQLQAVRRQYEGEIAAQSETLDEKMGLALEWAESNPDEFGGARSIETAYGTLGWRTGQPALKTLAGWTWDRVKETLKTAVAGDYIRTKEEVNKQSLLADRDALGAEKLRAIGLRVVQEESFFVEPRLAELADAAR